MNSSLRFWLILSFTFVIAICIAVLIVFIHAQVEHNKLETYIKTLQNTRIAILETNKIKEDIFISDLINPDFFEHKQSLQERKIYISFLKVNKLLSQLKKSNISSDHNFQNKIDIIEKNLLDYNQNFSELIKLFKLKGYKNYGLEGQMRLYAHAITENKDPQIVYYSLLLRKDEKDFLIRKELNYIYSFSETEGKLINYISRTRKYNSREKNELFNLVYFYNKYFKLIARIESKIGVKGKKGLLNNSNLIFERTNNSIKELERLVGVIEYKQNEDQQQMSILIMLSMVIFLILVTITLTNAITNSVTNITKTFTNYINSGFNDTNFDLKKSHIKEFNTIYIDFLKMAKEIHSYTNYFKEKVHERTLEINKQKEEIQFQQKQIEVQYFDLLNSNSDLIHQKKLLHEKNIDMLESLKYAQRIQKALIPKTYTYNKFFKDNFVFSKAKDIVSGDFNLIYPFKSYEVQNDQYISQNNVIFLAADCTGHGVPGAFISVLGMTSINKLVKLLNITDPGKLLDNLDSDINQFLSIDKKDKDLIIDGMDISVFSLNLETKQLNYCIAKFSCALIRNSELIPLIVQNHSIGYNIAATKDVKFETNTIQLLENDCLYVMSDGYSDQFGGPFNKKYKRKNLVELLLNIHKKPMKEQKLILKRELKEWQRNYSQTDDISVIGIRF